MKKKFKKLEKRLSYLPIQKNDPKRRKGGSSSKRRRNSKIVKMMIEKEDSGNDTQIASDSENNKTPVESAPGSLEVPHLKRENAFYGVFPQSNFQC